MSKPRRYRPGAWDALEERVVLSSFGLREPLQRASLGAWDRSPAAIAVASRPDPARRMPQFQQQRAPQALARRAFRAPARRLHQTPEVVIDQQYAAFSADVAAAFDEYLESLQIPLPQTIRLTLSAPYEPGNGLFVVDQTNLPTATPETPLQVAARPPGGSPRLYQVSGTAAGLLTGVLPYNPITGGFGTDSGDDNAVVIGIPEAPDAPLPAGTTLEISLPAASPNVGDIANQYFSSVTQRTLRLSSDLVTYFNRLPIRLPRLPGPYHTPRPQTAIQFYLTGQIAGQDPQILLQQLLAQPLPSGSGSTIDVYTDSISTIIETSRQQVREGVRLLFAGRSIADIQPVIPAQP